MKNKNELLKILGFKSCCICNNVFTDGEELRIIDGPYKEGKIGDEIHYFCNQHKPTFGHDIAFGYFGKYCKDKLKVFVWHSGSTECSPYWSQIDKEKVEEWLNKIYKD
jgi:hypothetical protein